MLLRTAMFAALLTALPAFAFAQPDEVKRDVVGNRTSENIPEIPVALIDQLNRYQNTRGAGVAGWTKNGCLLISTRFAETAQAHRAFLPRAELAAPSLADLLALDDADFRQVFAGSPIKRIGRGRMVRNAAIAAGNSGDARFVPVLERLTKDESPMVADAALWALAELAS